MSEFQYQLAKVPTFYYIGVTTGKSSINSVFPAWAENLAQIKNRANSSLEITIPRVFQKYLV